MLHHIYLLNSRSSLKRTYLGEGQPISFTSSYSKPLFELELFLENDMLLESQCYVVL